MATINVNRQGVGTGISNGNFNTARTNAASSVTDGITGEADVQYFATGRTKRFKRVFLHFDTSGITGTVTAAHIDINGGVVADADPNDTIMIKSTAFGGDGGTALATSDHFSSLDYSTAYSDELTTWSTGNNEYTLTAAALADIKNNDHFTLAIVDHDNDYANSATTGVADITIDFDVTITLDYTESASGYTHDVNGLAAASIGKVTSVATASIGKINSVD
jgi:hypothetical protein|tara:strand:- start:73 stop:735 length:663 start_codon:yes stop_codon:yes gene_type:complete